MVIQDVRIFLQNFIEKNRPPVILPGFFCFVFRDGKLTIVKNQRLLSSDIRIFTCEGSDLVKGFTADQWAQLTRNYLTIKKCLRKVKDL